MTSCEYCGTDIPDHGRDLVLNVRYETAPDVEACRQLANIVIRVMETGANTAERIFRGTRST